MKKPLIHFVLGLLVILPLALFSPISSATPPTSCDQRISIPKGTRLIGNNGIRGKTSQDATNIRPIRSQIFSNQLYCQVKIGKDSWLVKAADCVMKPSSLTRELSNVSEVTRAASRLSDPVTPALKGGTNSRLASKAWEVAARCFTPSQKVRQKTGKSKICGRSASAGMCYKGVKTALQESGAVNYYLGGGKAIEAHTAGHLARAGFRKIPCTPYNAPEGAVLVYSGGYAGHIEIRSNGNYCSDFCSPNPISSRLPRTLQACYVKEA